MRSRLKELRTRANLTQTELSERAGVVQSTVSKIEVGRGEGDDETLARIAAALGVSVQELFADDAPTGNVLTESRMIPAA